MKNKCQDKPQTRPHDERLLQGGGAVFSVAQAARLLPWSDGEARAWLYNQGLVIKAGRKAVVIWGDVLTALRQLQSEGKEPVAPKPKSKPKRHFKGIAGFPALNLAG